MLIVLIVPIVPIVARVATGCTFQLLCEHKKGTAT